MSILETFLLLFEADTTDLKKGGEEATQVTKKLEQKLSETNKQATKLGTSFTNMVNSAKGSLLALVGIGAISMGIKGAAHFADKLGELSEAINVDVEALSAWGDAVHMSGGTAEGFQETVKGMTAALADFATKGTSRAEPFFTALGIRMVDAKGKARNFIDVLPELAGAFEKLGKSQSFGIGRKMGLDEGTIMLLQRGRKAVIEFVDRQKELGVVTKRDAETAAKFNDQLDDTGHAFRSLFTSVNGFVLPVLTATFKFFERLAVHLRQNPALVKGIGLAFGALLAVFAPVATAIAAIGTAFVLLADDIDHFEKGHKSVIGDLINKYPRLGNAVYQVLKGFGKFFDVVGGGFKLILTLVEKLFDALATIGESIAFIFDKAAAAYDKIKSKLGLGGGNVEASVTSGQQTLAAAGATPLASITNNALSSASRSLTRNTTVPISNITIQTQATDAQTISTDISKSLEVQIRQAIQNSDDGVLI